MLSTAAAVGVLDNVNPASIQLRVVQLRDSVLHVTEGSKLRNSVTSNTGFVQKYDCGFPDFSRTKLLLFPDFSRHFVHLYVNINITKLAFKC